MLGSFFSFRTQPASASTPENLCPLQIAVPEARMIHPEWRKVRFSAEGAPQSSTHPSQPGGRRQSQSLKAPSGAVSPRLKRPGRNVNGEKCGWSCRVGAWLHPRRVTTLSQAAAPHLRGSGRRTEPPQKEGTAFPDEDPVTPLISIFFFYFYVISV